jgi:ring-1,2-phenylacetyl-CoA epoxidase subunit PaaD
MEAQPLSVQEVWNILSEIPDPEIPVITIAELGVLRKVDWDGTKYHIQITPTYSGCPAIKMMEFDIVQKLIEHQIANYTIDTILNPAWTTDWMNESTRNKLKEYGIAPPNAMVKNKVASMLNETLDIHCPRCESINTEVLSEFGSTACKSLHKCKDCLETFDYFKCH